MIYSVFEKFLRPAESVRFIVKDENFSKTIAKDCQVSKEEKIFGTHLSQSSEVQASNSLGKSSKLGRPSSLRRAIFPAFSKLRK